MVSLSVFSSEIASECYSRLWKWIRSFQFGGKRLLLWSVARGSSFVYYTWEMCSHKTQEVWCNLPWTRKDSGEGKQRLWCVLEYVDHRWRWLGVSWRRYITVVVRKRVKPDLHARQRRIRKFIWAREASEGLRKYFFLDWLKKADMSRLPFTWPN